MRDLDEQLRSWTDQAEPVTVDDVDAKAAAQPVGRNGRDRRGRAAAWALIAAAILAVAGFAVVTSDDGGDEPPASPGPQTTVVEPAVTTSMPQILPQRLGDPETLVGFTADGRLISIDPVTGEERAELASGYSAADEVEVEGGPYVISSATVDRTTGDLFYGTCCEPAVGEIFRVGDGPAERYRYGDLPAVSPDGSMLAFVELEHLKIVDIASGEILREWSLAAEGPIGEGGTGATSFVLSDISWSQDASQLVLVASRYPEARVTVRVVEVDDTSSGAVFAAAVVAEGPIEGADRPKLPRFDPDGLVSYVFEQPGADGAAVSAQVVRLRIGGQGAVGDVETVDQAVLSRFWVGDAEWRLLADGTVTVDGDVRFTTPGLRLLAG